MCYRTIIASVTAQALFCLTLQAQEQASDIGQRFLATPTIQAALDAARRLEPAIIENQITLCEIPAPPFGEAARAQALFAHFERLGLRNVRIDEEGNVLSERPGNAARPHLVLSAHLDTVFPPGTDVQVSRSGTLLEGPGISDDCRGLAVLLGIAEALDSAGVMTHGPITFVGTVGEEGLGDLRGVKHLFSTELRNRIDRFVTIDGSGYRFSHVAVGSHRYRVTFKGPGGHSHASFGIPNPIHAVGRAIARIAELEIPDEPRTTFNVGRVGGGISINSIADEAWMEVDLRSSDSQILESLDQQFRQAVTEALADERARWENDGLTVLTTRVGDRPAGRILPESPIVRAVISVTRALDLPFIVEEGSSDANVAISLGIPALWVGAGGRGTGVHSLSETFDTTDSWKGTQRALLLAVALTQP